MPRVGLRFALFALITSLCVGCDRPSEGVGPEGKKGSPPTAPTVESPSLPDELAAQHPILSPNAKVETFLLLREEALRKKSPGDGAGRMWIQGIEPIRSEATPNANESKAAAPDAAPRPLIASSYARFEFVFEVGDPGIDVGGVVFFQPDPFWEWSPAQTQSANAPGYTTARAEKEGVELFPDASAASFQVAGEPLEKGDRIVFVYGAGEAGARVDRYADRRAEMLVGVDADGDGFRAWVEEVPSVEIKGGPATRLIAMGPAEVRPGEKFSIQLAVVDAVGNRAEWPGGEDANSPHASREEGSLKASLLASSTVQASPAPLGKTTPRNSATPLLLTFSAPKSQGTLRYAVRGEGAFEGLVAEANPILVRNGDLRLYWGDLHGHSGVSDGTGTPRDYFEYARDTARLDAIALTDHDHWGVRPLDASREEQTEILKDVDRFHEPGRFVTIPGYEWTNWLHGHRHVLYFEAGEASQGHVPIYSAMDPSTDRPDELWAALRGRDALTFAHHPAGEPIATNWFYRPDPILEPVVEIASVHGSSEAEHTPYRVERGIDGYFVRDTLMRGDRLGFIGSGDSHDGHPGLAGLASPSTKAGLAGIYAADLDRASLLDALQSRRTFATNGIRPFLEVRIDETFMGGTVAEHESQTLHVQYEATAPIERVDLVRSGVVASLDSEGRIWTEDAESSEIETLSLEWSRTIPGLHAGEFHYVRIIQTDGGVAWSSPIFGPEVEPLNKEELGKTEGKGGNE